MTLATFMEVLDTSIANVSLPHIAGGLSASVDESTWVLTAYLVANAIVLPLSAWVSGFIGRKRFYMTCVALFTISSLFCGFAPTLSSLVIFRIIQGAGGGGLQPSEQAILADTFPGEKFGMAFAMYGMAVVLAPAIGPTLGGYITDHFNWRWIFFINVPIGIISLLLTYRMVEDPPYLKKEKRKAGWRANIDFIGLGLIVLGLGCLQVVLDRGQELDWFGSRMITWFIDHLDRLADRIPHLGVASEASHPRSQAVPRAHFRNRHPYDVHPRLRPVRLDYPAAALPPTTDGLYLAVSRDGAVAGRIRDRTDDADRRHAGVQGAGAMADRASASSSPGSRFLSMSNINPSINFQTAMIYRIQQSIGLAFLFVPITTIAYLGIPPNKNNQVSSLISLARNIGGSVGIAMVTTMVARRSQFHQDRIASHMTGYDHVFRNGVQRLSLEHDAARLQSGGREPAGVRANLWPDATAICVAGVRRCDLGLRGGGAVHAAAGAADEEE